MNQMEKDLEKKVDWSFIYWFIPISITILGIGATIMFNQIAKANETANTADKTASIVSGKLDALISNVNETNNLLKQHILTK